MARRKTNIFLQTITIPCELEFMMTRKRRFLVLKTKGKEKRRVSRNGNGMSGDVVS